MTALPAHSLRLDWRGCELLLLPGRALCLPWAGTLLIADWHLGKDDVFRRAGIALPAGSLEGELARLDGLIESTAARELVVLGDLVHGAVHTGAPWRREFSRWRARHPGLALRVARGNHDRHLDALAAEIDEMAPAITLGPISAVHEVDRTAPGLQLGGHLHPVVRLRAGRQRERVPVYWIRHGQIVLPAFGRLTGGWPLPAKAGGRVYAALDGSVIPLPAGD
jgi:DNA ligase-associated metallophosphoesterase